jgi:hypothetical protein
MLKYLSKFAMDILPSVVATIVGAYIVNHYINTKPADAPAVAAVAPADSRKKTDIKSDVKASEVSPDGVTSPEPGVRAKGISERAMIERSTADKAVFEKPAEKEKAVEKPTETASIPVETKRPAPREKTVVKVAPLAAQPAVAPVAVAPVTPAPVEASIAPDDHRDVNDLARAAIERLRGGSEAAPRSQEAARAPEPRAPETTRVVTAPPVAAMPPVRPLPPPIMVSTPAPDASAPVVGSSPIRPPYTDAMRSDDPNRPTPPADIPVSRPPLDLRAEAAAPAPREHTNVAEDVLSAAKSMFHSVIPK